MNSNRNNDPQNAEFRKPRSLKAQPALIAASIGAVLCLAFGVGATAEGASANPVARGHFKMGAADQSGFYGEYGGWTDQANGSPDSETRQMLAPTGTSCTISSGALGLDPKVTLRWSVPTEMKGYSVEQAEFGVLRDGEMKTGTELLGSTVGDPAAYETVLTGVPAIDGSSKRCDYGVRFQEAQTGKASPWLMASVSMGSAGMNATCTMGIR